ncbi:MAG TPA: hypothetical protein VJN92_16480 [Candidatus Acidoferrum sp.]|nr:hypothetical protein [Candidatus Acidoferrum sp.]
MGPNEFVRNIVQCALVYALTVGEMLGIRAVNGGAAGFPMEADRWVGKMWVISHKPVARGGRPLDA